MSYILMIPIVLNCFFWGAGAGLLVYLLFIWIMPESVTRSMNVWWMLWLFWTPFWPVFIWRWNHFVTIMQKVALEAAKRDRNAD